MLPNDVEVQLTAATFLLAARRGEDALARVESALKLEPNNIDAHLIRGNALAGLSSFDEALKASEEAIRLDPARGTTVTHLARVELARGRRDEAESAFKRAVTLAPKSVDVYLALGHFYWSVANPSSAEAQFALGRLYQMRGEHVRSRGRVSRGAADQSTCRSGAG